MFPTSSNPRNRCPGTVETFRGLFGTAAHRFVAIPVPHGSSRRPSGREPVLRRSGQPTRKCGWPINGSAAGPVASSNLGMMALGAKEKQKFRRVLKIETFHDTRLVMGSHQPIAATPPVMPNFSSCAGVMGISMGPSRSSRQIRRLRQTCKSFLDPKSGYLQ